jgi:hypothetical protein
MKTGTARPGSDEIVVPEIGNDVRAETFFLDGFTLRP